MSIRHVHHRAKRHQSFAVRFAYWNFIINSVFTLVWGIPVMCLIFLYPHLAYSVKWVSFLSVWALFATHAGGAIAAFSAVHAAVAEEHATAVAEEHASNL
jgi:hypothetical protein